MTDEKIRIPYEDLNYIGLQDDGRLWVAFNPIENRDPTIHLYPHRNMVIGPEHPAYSEFLRVTGISKPGDYYSFALERFRNAYRKSQAQE